MDKIWLALSWLLIIIGGALCINAVVGLYVVWLAAQAS